VRLTTVSTRANSVINIHYLLAKAGKERLSMLLHLVRRVTPYCVLIALHLIDKACAEPLQVVIG